MSPEIHAAAATGFGRAADAYERGRPDFPAEALRYLAEALELRPGRTVVDLGAGTGKMTRLLTATGARTIAVEPVAEMLAVLAASTPEAMALRATAEHLPLAGGAAHAAVAAQSFHWFDARLALTSLARVLPPGGPLALVWNVRDETEPWVAALTTLIEPFRGDTPSHRALRWRAAFDDAAPWTPPDRASFVYRHRTDREAVVDRVLSISFVAALDASDRADVAERVRGLLPSGDEIVFPYRTDVWCTRRR